MSKTQFRVLMLLMAAGVALTVFFSGCTDTSRIEELEWRIDALENNTKVIEAQGFRLVDKEGKIRAALGLGTGTNDGPSLRLYDTDGHLRTHLCLFADTAPGLLLFDAHREARGILMLEPNGRPGLWLSDATGNERICLYTTEAGSPSVSLRDAAGNSRAVIGCEETVVVRSGVHRKHAESTITLFDDSNKVLWQAP